MFFGAVTNIVIQRPRRAYDRLKQYRRSRARSEKLQWDVTKWFQLHPSLKLGYKLCIYPVASIFVLNLIVTIWAATTRPVSDGLTVALFTGKCSTIQGANFWIHILINALAAILFAASSYMMQRLAAPTRRDVDNNHQHNRSLKIGSLAPSNFMLLGGLRLPTFLLLWSSSLPLHLMYNSLVVKTSTNAEWSKYVVLLDRDVVPNGNVNATTRQTTTRDWEGFSGLSGDVTQPLDVARLIVAQTPPLTRLSPADCIEKYASGRSTDWGDVILVSSITTELYSYQQGEILFDPGYSSSIGGRDKCLQSDGKPLPWDWMCSNAGSETELCQPDQVINTGIWSTGDKPIEFCLARKLPPSCELNMSLSIMIAVQLCIIGKLVAMTITALLSREQPLVTVGDAISSFLSDHDETTDGICTAGPEHFLGSWSIISHHGIHARGNRRRTVFFELPGAYVWTNVM